MGSPRGPHPGPDRAPGAPAPEPPRSLPRLAPATAATRASSRRRTHRPPLSCAAPLPFRRHSRALTGPAPSGVLRRSPPQPCRPQDLAAAAMDLRRAPNAGFPSISTTATRIRPLHHPVHVSRAVPDVLDVSPTMPACSSGEASFNPASGPLRPGSERTLEPNAPLHAALLRLVLGTARFTFPEGIIFSSP
nr:predicted GPI-anchored protein 58 [Aegilops tauschii subsp. strangulata]